MPMASSGRQLMQEPLLPKHRAHDPDALDALAGNLHGNDSGVAPNPHEEDAKNTPLQPHKDERDAGNLQDNDSGAARNPHEEEDDKKTPLQPHEVERDELLDAENSQPNEKENGSLKPPSLCPKKQVNRDKNAEVEMQTPTLASLLEQAREFTESAAGTSMATAADALCSAAEQFASGKGRKKKVIETDLNKTAMTLFSVAQAAPNSEARLATRAIYLTSAAQMVLLSDNDTKPGWWRWQRPSSGPGTPKQPSLKQRLRAAIPHRKHMLPIYADHEKQLMDKREVLYALAIAAPVAILTAAAGLKVFDGEWAMVAGVSAGVWVLAAGGMVLNQYGVFDWELLAARHLGRIGILGAAVLFCFFTYRAFFPSTLWALMLLLIITAIALGLPWILSCARGDDIASAKSNGDAVARASKLEMREGEPVRRHTI